MSVPVKKKWDVAPVSPIQNFSFPKVGCRSCGMSPAAEVIRIPQADADGRTNLVNFERVRKYLDVSRSTLLRYIYDRKIDAIKMDGGWRFHWSDVDRFVRRRTQKAA